MPTARRRSAGEDRHSQDSQASDSVESEVKAVMLSIKAGAEKKVRKKQTDFGESLRKESELWDDRWAEVINRHQEEWLDLYHESKAALDANAKEQALVKAQLDECKADLLKLLTRAVNLFSKANKEWYDGNDTTNDALSKCTDAEERCLIAGLAGVAKRDRASSFSSAVVATDASTFTG